MASRWGKENGVEDCPVCGLSYDSFHSEFRYYRDVRMLLWVGVPNYAEWKYKRRNTVLGLWHQLKMAYWKEHLYACEIARLYFENEQAKREIVGRLPEERAELAMVLEETSTDPDVLASIRESKKVVQELRRSCRASRKVSASANAVGGARRAKVDLSDVPF